MSSGPPPPPPPMGVAIPAGENHPLATPAVGQQATTQKTSQDLSQQKGQNKPSFESASSPPSKPLARVDSSALSPPPPPPPKAVSPSSKSLDELVDDFLSFRKKSYLLRPNPLPKGQVEILRLRTLVERRAWGDVLKLASTILGNGLGENHGSNSKKSPKKSNSSKSKEYSRIYHSLLLGSESREVQEATGEDNQKMRIDTIEIMILQCNACLKLRRYGDLSAEIKRWKFLKQNDVTAEPIDWIPWGVHILAAQSLEYSEEKNQVQDVLCHLKESIPSTEYGWLTTLDNAMANVYIRRGDWRLALGSFDEIIRRIPDTTEEEVKSMGIQGDDSSDDASLLKKFLTHAYTCEILSRQGRIFLQAGGIAEAAELFDDAKDVWKETESMSSAVLSWAAKGLGDNGVHAKYIQRLQVSVPTILFINEGLLRFSESNYEYATQSFAEAIATLQTWSENGWSAQYCEQDWIGPTRCSPGSLSMLYNEAMNNTTLCYLYSCRLKEALWQLEGLVREDPTVFLTERVAFNLCTLYELGSDSAVASRNKRVLQLIAKRFFLHDIGPESFRTT